MKDKLVTVFGGGGFVGRHVAQALMAQGARLRLAQRDLASTVRVQPMSALGQSQFVAADIVINLVGILAGDFDAVHHQGAANVARAAAQAGVETLVHMSALGADAGSPAAYGRSKAAGEQAVRAAFPDAIIMRPSVIFGAEDQFLNRFADLIRMAPVVPVIAPDTRFQPVYVKDVAHAIANAALDPAGHRGQTFELVGPQTLSMMELNRWIAKAIGRDRSLVPVPAGIASLIASLGFLPGAPITRDQYAMLQKDNVGSVGAPGLRDLDVEATPMVAVADRWLVHYRRHGRFAGRVQA